MNGKTDVTADEILNDAIQSLADRAKLRDKDNGERSMSLAVEIFNQIRHRGLTEEDGWWFMVALKIARSQQGGFSADDYVDLAGYAALTGECCARD